MKKRNFILYMRNFIFGAEDSLVSTVGLLAGSTWAGVSGPDLVITGMVLIFVEAFSMSVGSFLSEETTEEYEFKKQKIWLPFFGAIIMFLSYFITGLIPLAPYLLTQPENAFWISIILTLISLFLLGIISARLLGAKLLRNALRMFFIGGAAVVIGVFVGSLFGN